MWAGEMNHRYASHGLRFDVIRPLEPLRRVSRADIQDRVGRPQRPAAERRRDPRMGDRRAREDARLPPLGLVGGKATDLAHCNRSRSIRSPAGGRSGSHLGRHDRKARYSLIVTIETPETDIYTLLSRRT